MQSGQRATRTLLRNAGMSALVRAREFMRKRARAYALVVAACAIAFLVAASLRATDPATPHFMLFAAVVVAASLLGGAGPGLLATALGLIGGVVLQGGAPIRPGAASMFVTIGLAASLLGYWAERRRRIAERLHRLQNLPPPERERAMDQMPFWRGLDPSERQAVLDFIQRLTQSN